VALYRPVMPIVNRPVSKF